MYLMDAIDGHPHHGVDYVPCRLVQRENRRCRWIDAAALIREAAQVVVSR